VQQGLLGTWGLLTTSEGKSTPEAISPFTEWLQVIGMTQAQLANWLGVVIMHVSHLEQGIRPVGSQTTRFLEWLVEKIERGTIKIVQPKKQRATHEH
jgi:predicted transcriptional regulator